MEQSSSRKATGAYVFNGSFNGSSAVGFVGTGARIPRYKVSSGLRVNSLAVSIGDNGGPTGLLKQGTGVWTLNANNTYTGVTTITQGILRIGNPAASARRPRLRLQRNHDHHLELDHDGRRKLELRGHGYEQRGPGTHGHRRRFHAQHWYRLRSGPVHGQRWLQRVRCNWSSLRRRGHARGRVRGTGGFFNTPNAFILGSATADSTVTVLNTIDLNGATRTVQSDNGPVLIEGILAGPVINSSGTAATFTKSGAGVLELTSSVQGTGTVNTNVTGGYLLLPNLTTAVPGAATSGRNITIGFNAGVLLPGATQTSAGC